MSLEEIKALAHRMVDCINRNDMAAADEVFAEGFVNHNPQFGITPDRDGLKKMIAGFHQGFPDYRLSIEDIIAEDDRIALRVRNTGTHTGSLMGIPASHKRLDIRSVTLLHMADGKIQERWNFVNEKELLTQLGLM